MYTTKTAWWDAKNRFGMPEKLPLAWESIAPIFGNSPVAAAPVQNPQPVQTEQPSTPSAPPVQQMIEKAQQAGVPTEAIESSGYVDLTPNSSGYQRVQGIPDALADLMQANNVTAEQIEYVSIDLRHYMAQGMKIQQFPQDYLMYLTTIWDQVVSLIQANCKDYVPF